MVNVIDLNKLVEFSYKKGLLDTMEDRQRVKKNVFKATNFNIVLIFLESGQEIPSRPEPYEVCFYIIDGSGTFSVGEEKYDLSKGNIIFASANVARGIKSKERLTVLGIQEPH
ncbi:MAG: cupin domain-containing protein [Nitrososphaerales archaeon]